MNQTLWLCKRIFALDNCLQLCWVWRLFCIAHTFGIQVISHFYYSAKYGIKNTEVFFTAAQNTYGKMTRFKRRIQNTKSTKHMLGTVLRDSQKFLASKFHSSYVKHFQYRLVFFIILRNSSWLTSPSPSLSASSIIS